MNSQLTVVSRWLSGGCRLLLPIVALIAVLASPSALAQSYPNRVVTLVTTVTAGGSVDAVARLLAAALSKSLGQNVIVEPRPGAGGNLAAGYVASAPADGHTLLMGVSPTFTLNPHIYKSVPFDSEKSFAPIIMPAKTNQILVVNPAKVSATNLQEFIAQMKAEPGKFNYGTSGIGASSHLASEILGLLTGTKATHVPYRGIAPAITDLLGGQVDFVFDSATTIQHIQTGRLRALAVVGPSKIAALPDVKTFRELGLEGMEVANSWYAISAPAGTPADIIKTLNSELAKILDMASTKEAIAGMGLEPTTSTPEATAAAWSSELKRFGVIVKQINLTVQ